MFIIENNKKIIVLKGYSNVLGAKNHYWSKYGSRDCKFLFLGELGTYPQNLISMRRIEP
jgi:hypothetical protein